ncbi:MAG: hypothetical protein DWI57_11955 [Chloroflexi bacterium]|nr:MAG: hypothetical protein DWI57_11955 [Chloroflexota bacterium]
MKSTPSDFVTEDEWTEDEWLYAAARNPAFDFLAGSREDIYSVDEGKLIEVIPGKFSDAVLRR